MPTRCADKLLARSRLNCAEKSLLTGMDDELPALGARGATTGYAPAHLCRAPARVSSPAMPRGPGKDFRATMWDEPLFARLPVDLLAQMPADDADAVGTVTPPRENASPARMTSDPPTLDATLDMPSRKRQRDADDDAPDTSQRRRLRAPERPDLRARRPHVQAPPRAPPPPMPARRPISNSRR